MSQGIAPETVRRTLEEVLARDAFRREESWLQRLLERVFGDLALPSLGLDPGVVLFALLAVAGLALGAFVVMRLARDARGARSGAARATDRTGADRARARAAELLRDARAARARGDLTLALRLTFFALVVGLGRRGALEYHDAWTNRELLARGHPEPAVAALLAPLLGELDRKSFGGEETRAADVERMEELCVQLGVEG